MDYIYQIKLTLKTYLKTLVFNNKNKFRGDIIKIPSKALYLIYFYFYKFLFNLYFLFLFAPSDNNILSFTILFKNSLTQELLFNSKTSIAILVVIKSFIFKYSIILSLNLILSPVIPDLSPVIPVLSPVILSVFIGIIVLNISFSYITSI